MKRSNSKPINGTYRELVDYHFDKGGIIPEEPDVLATIEELQKLAFVLCEKIEWVAPAILRGVEPGLSQEQAVKEAIQYAADNKRLMKAMIEREVERCPDSGQLKTYGIARVAFFDVRFLTVGVLLHEMAHMHPFAKEHDNKFQTALSELVSAWKNINKP